jgi:carbon-monoxide dehydrogenase small subunit
MQVEIRVNGQKRSADVPPETTLLKFLREYLDLTGAKLGCDVGDCGTCTVIVDGEVVNSCIMLAVKANGSEVQTVEGLANNHQLHPLQQAFEELGSLQCGFCGTGMLMAAKKLLDDNPYPTRLEIRDHLTGNLCRCTGYTKIIEAIELAAKRIRFNDPGYTDYH